MGVIITLEEDTIHLLKEVNAGCKMATSSMEHLLPCISNQAFARLIHGYNKEHVSLGDEVHEMLNQHGADEKDPHPMAKAMSWITTEMKITMESDQKHVAKLLMDGCNMGIQSVSGYINQYKEANKQSKEIASRLVKLEQDFMNDLKKYL